MARGSQYARNQQGLTLVELLIAILLTGLIATYGLSIMQAIIDGHFGVKRSQQTLTQLSQMQVLLEGDMLQLQPNTSVRNSLGQSESAVVLSDSGAAVTFSRLGWLLSEFDDNQRSNLQRVSWSLHPEGDSVCRHVRLDRDGQGPANCLVRSYDYEMDTLSDEDIKQVDVLGGVQALAFSFFTVIDHDHDQGRWESEWPEAEDATVAAVKVSIDHMDLGPLYWVFPIPQGWQ